MMIATTVDEAQARLRLRFGRGAQLRFFDRDDGTCHVSVNLADGTFERGPDATSFNAAVIAFLFPERTEIRP